MVIEEGARGLQVFPCECYRDELPLGMAGQATGSATTTRRPTAGRWHPHGWQSRPLARMDFLIWSPKLQGALV